MKKIKWHSKGVDFEEAKIGNMVLWCNRDYDSVLWSSYVTISCISSTMRRGPNRKSKLKAREDAIRLAKELLIDYNTSIAAEMKNFDLEI